MFIFKVFLNFGVSDQRNGDYAKLYALDEGNTLGMFGLFHDYNTLEKECTYSIMVINNHEKK